MTDTTGRSSVVNKGRTAQEHAIRDLSQRLEDVAREFGFTITRKTEVPWSGHTIRSSVTMRHHNGLSVSLRVDHDPSIKDMNDYKFQERWTREGTRKDNGGAVSAEFDDEGVAV